MAGNRSTTLASSVARQIEREIIESGWNAGVFLGNEEDLGRTYGVGRATLREAIRLLDHSSLIEMRRGPGGGLYVRSPPTSAVVETMIVYFELSDLTLQEIYEARQVIESLAVQLSIEHADDAALEGLDELSEGDTDDPTSFRLSQKIADISSNAAMSLFVEALTRLARSRIEERGGVPALVDGEVRRRLVAALRARDPVGAAAAMTSMLDLECDAEIARPWLVPDDGDRPAFQRTGPTLLADQVALAIRREIVAKGWPEGHVLGSEAQLLATFNVSRATLREAVRILEHHSIASMRRGPGGGLVVQRPDPGRAIDTACRYLEHIKFDTADLRAIRDAVERATAALAARRITPVGAARLGQALERERLIDPTEINKVSHTIHAILAELAGNRFLEFCTAILSRLTGGNVDRERVSTDLERVRAEVNLIHSRIVEAVVHGNDARAAALMGAHLEAVMTHIDLDHVAATH